MRKSSAILISSGIVTLSAATAAGYIGTRLPSVTAGDPTQQNNCDNPNTGRRQEVAIVKAGPFTQITKKNGGACNPTEPAVESGYTVLGLPVTYHRKCVPYVESCRSFISFNDPARLSRPGDIFLRVAYHGVPTAKEAEDFRLSFKHANRILCDATDG
jgi:hypothetical protein